MIAALQIFLQTSSQLYEPTPAPNLIHLLFKAFRRSPFSAPVFSHPNFFPSHTSAKSTRNSFRCHTYNLALLQVLSLPHIQKTGVSPLGVRRSCRRFSRCQ